MSDIKAAHCGSPTSHPKADGTPARIVTCDDTTFSDPGGLASIGDLVEGHPYGGGYHEPNPIVPPVASFTFVGNDDRRVARVGDRTQCGAVILPDDPDEQNVFVE